MVGIFSRFSATKAIGLFSHSSQEGKDVGNTRETAGFSMEHGVEPAEEFMPIEHPMEPSENDQPVQCPQPEPCIIHDGRIWKEKLHLSMKKRNELPFIRENETQGRLHIVPAQHLSSSPIAPKSSTKSSLA